MTARTGRNLRIRRGTTPIAGARTDSITINNEPLDITDKDNAGWRTFLADAGVRSIDCEVEGVLEDSTLIAISVGTAANLLESYTIAITGLGTFTGNFYLNNLQLSGEMADVVTFTASIQSSGQVTFA